MADVWIGFRQLLSLDRERLREVILWGHRCLVASRPRACHEMSREGQQEQLELCSCCPSLLISSGLKRSRKAWALASHWYLQKLC